jgi:hypothetical protein
LSQSTVHHPRVSVTFVRPLNPWTLVALIGSAIAAAGLFGLGNYALLATERPWLFGLALSAVGLIAGALVLGGFRRHRPSWAYLIATWIVIGVCAFFTAPKVLRLPKVHQVTVELEEKMGRRGAEEYMDGENFKARMIVLGVCLGFVAPFAALCVGFAIGRRDYERIV